MVGPGRSLAQELEYVVQFARNLGVPFATGNRLERMQNLLTGLDGSPKFVQSDHPDFEIALEAVRDVQQLGFIFDQMDQNKINLPAHFRDRVRQFLLSDPALPQTDLAASPGRDIQCELYVFAVCLKAGLSPEFAEPDVCCNYQGTKFAVAVKRIKSEGKFEERIREGVRQITRAAICGIVYADISVMLNRSNARITRNISDNALGEVWHQDMSRFVDPLYYPLKRSFSGTEARGLFLAEHHVHEHPEDGWGLSSFAMAVSYSQFNQRRQREFYGFWDRFMSGLPTEVITVGN